MAISIAEALDMLDQTVEALTHELVTIEESPGRIAASEYVASFNMPRFDNSAMDGYAVRLVNRGDSVKSKCTLFAGDKADFELYDNEAVRIMTGAPVPAGCEAVVPVENVTVEGETVILPESIEAGAHIRLAGEDMQKGQRYITQGERITAYHTALLASQGVTHISVTRKVRVALFGTGNELRPHYERIEAHQLYNSNTMMFLTRAKELGCEVRYIGSSQDTLDSLRSCIREALDADLVITSGGVSVGDRDFTKEAFGQLGMQVLFSGVEIKPGKPTTVGRIGNTYIVNLPGNPLAAMANYELFVKPIILKLSGSSAVYPGIVKTKIRETYRLKPGRYSIILGSYNGSSFSPLPQQSPGMVSPLKEADGLIITGPGLTQLEKGKEVLMLPIRWLMASESKKVIFTT